MVKNPELWLTELPEHQVTMRTTRQLVARGGYRGWVIQPRAECSCGWGEGGVTLAGMYDIIRGHLRQYGWRATQVSA